MDDQPCLQAVCNYLGITPKPNKRGNVYTYQLIKALTEKYRIVTNRHAYDETISTRYIDTFKPINILVLVATGTQGHIYLTDGELNTIVDTNPEFKPKYITSYIYILNIRL